MKHFNLRTSLLAALAIACVGVLSYGPSKLAAQVNGAIITLQDGAVAAPSLNSVTNPTGGLRFPAAGVTEVIKHLSTGGPAAFLPAVSTCGTSSALATGSTDVAGKITVGTTASNACTLTFGTAWTTAPFCVVQNKTTGAAANVYTVSTTAIVWSSALADSSELFYHCIGAQGG